MGARIRVALALAAICGGCMASSPLDCDFESPGMCGYRQDPYDTADWLRHSGPTPTPGTGPSADHTLGNSSGHYMYYDPALKFSFVHLWSPPFTPAGDQCYLVFYYLMFGDRVNWLGVSLGSLQSNFTRGKSLMDKYGPHSTNSTDWIMGQVELPSTGPTVNVVFQAQGIAGDIAIDDVKVICGAMPGCLSNPCLNGALCTDVGVSGFHCTCAAGFTGNTCEVKIAAQTAMASVHIVANPTSIKEGQTAYMKVNCTFDHRGSKFDALSFLILYKSTLGDNTNYREVAVVSSSTYTVVTKDDLGASTVTGLLDAAGVSFIAYEWFQPKDSTKGHYMCEAQGMDGIGQPVTSVAITTVGEVVADFTFLMQKIEQLNASLLMQSGGGTAQVNELERKLNNLTLLLNDQKVLLTTQSAQITSLSTMLNSKEAQLNNQSIQISNLVSKLQIQKEVCNNQTTQNAIKLNNQSVQISSQMAQIVDLSTMLTSKEAQLNNQTTQNAIKLNNQSVEISSLVSKLQMQKDDCNNQTAQNAIKLNNQSALISSQSVQIASLSTMLNNKEAQLNNQSVEISNLVSKLQIQKDDCNNKTTQNAIQLNNQSTQISSQSVQIASLSTMLNDKEAQLNNQSVEISNLVSKLEMQKDDCNNQTAQNDIKLKDLQFQLDNYGYRLDVQMTGQLDSLNATVRNNTEHVNMCVAGQTKDHNQIANQTSRIDELMSMQNNQTSQIVSIFHQIDNSRTAVMQTSTGFRGKYYFLSRPMWRNMASYEGTCQLYGGHMVEVDDQKEFDFLSQFIRDNNVTERVVIGGTDQGSEGSWRFQASSQPMVYFNWATGFPSSSVFENCVMMEGYAGWKMENTHCDAKEWNRFICEMTV